MVALALQIAGVSMLLVMVVEMQVCFISCAEHPWRTVAPTAGLSVIGWVILWRVMTRQLVVGKSGEQP